MKTRVKIAACCLTLLLALGLTGCGTAQTAELKVTVQYWCDAPGQETPSYVYPVDDQVHNNDHGNGIYSVYTVKKGDTLVLDGLDGSIECVVTEVQNGTVMLRLSQELIADDTDKPVTRIAVSSPVRLTTDSFDAGYIYEFAVIQ